MKGGAPKDDKGPTQRTEGGPPSSKVAGGTAPPSSLGTPKNRTGEREKQGHAEPEGEYRGTFDPDGRVD